MNKLPNELKNEICNYLTDIDSINFLTIHKNPKPVRYLIKICMPLNQYEKFTNKTVIELVIRKSIITEYIDYLKLDAYKITHLTFGWKFNHKVDNLPNSITHLEFRDIFNQEVDNLPNSITHLIFGYHFNQRLDNLPDSITYF